MATRLGLIFSILAFRALALPAEPPQPASSEAWSLMSFRRACSEDQAKCTYSFLISEDPTKAPKYCDFTVDAAGGLPAYQTDFSVLECPGAPEYKVNGGWDERKFVTLTVINEKRGLLSFFSARDLDLWAGNEVTPQTSNVYNHPMLTKREMVQVTEEKTKKDTSEDDEAEKEKKRLIDEMKRQEAKDREDQKKLEEARERDGGISYASEWKLVDVTRYEFLTGPYTDKLVMMFGIQSGNSTIESCHINVRLYEGLKPLGKSFAYQDCKSGGWAASWGHNETTGHAVMTLFNKYKDRVAYYGFTEVNTNVLLGDKGPRPTYWL
ncbi:hypothetical protein LX32DRAFT_77784 [Colletotrichum zoysiae]|uniref:Uncharacterized protein n=1 Tax=Colletotrichum zoysiae TaxID=1216348 RepID=A0AAD9LXY2_9PEZI|nr:hypothetical protein LX32DRAFT_77784 [Colletotrichum zoysiae]